jgi:hypothetical protein
MFKSEWKGWLGILLWPLVALVFAFLAVALTVGR